MREPNGYMLRFCAEALQEASMTQPDTNNSQSASDLISEKIAALGGWRSAALARMRKLILEAAPDVVETWKWMGTPVWEHNGILCTGESYKNKIKLTFAKGAFLKDPASLFNSSLDGSARRALDIFEGGEVDTMAFKALIQEAVALNGTSKAKPAKKQKAH